MNNEIKDILNNLDFNVNHTNNWKKPLGLKQETWKQLLDYITNLDEKNKELKKKITFNEKSRRKMQQSLMEQIEDYKSRIEKAVEYIEHNTFKDSDGGWVFRFYKGKEILLDILNGRSDE